MKGRLEREGVYWFVRFVEDESRRYRVHISDIKRLGLDAEHKGKRVFARIAADIYPPTNANGWIENKSMVINE